jgi:hypothetical protein
VPHFFPNFFCYFAAFFPHFSSLFPHFWFRERATLNIIGSPRKKSQKLIYDSLTSIKLNSDFDCKQAYDIFISNSDLLNQVKSSEKYQE